MQRIWPVFLLALMSLPLGAWAQPYDEVPSVTSTIALTNVRIVTAPGEIVQDGTVVMRDGLIEAVGPNVSVPYDADPIDGGDTLTVYAGFIDGLSHAGIPDQEDSNTDDVERPGDPPPDRAGIQPDRHAQALMNPDDPSLEKLRQVGFTAAHVVPRGAMLPGTGALVVLSEEDDADALVMQRDVSLFAQLEGAPGGYAGAYPATKMAVLAKMRQLYREAQRRQQLEDDYEREPAGKKRPSYDPEHTALFPVLNGEQPFVFHTEHPLDIFRVLNLQETLGFPLMLTGLKGAHLALDALRTTDTPLFLALDLPEAPDDTTASDSLAAAIDSAKVITPDKPGTFFKRETRTISYEDTQEEREVLKRRQAMERARYYHTADTLSDLGKRFGFSTLTVKPKSIRDNLRTMIAHGLSEEDALAALTTNAARHLGVTASMGTIEPGKMANLVVTEGGSYFDEDSQVRFVFVEGQKFEIEASSPDTEDAPANPAGTWAIEAATPDGALGATLVLSGSPDDLSGSLQLPDGDALPLKNVTLDEEALSFSGDTDEYGEITVDLSIQADELEGSAELPSGETVPVTGSRIPQ